MAIITVEDLSFTYAGQDKQALSHIDLTIEEGAFVCILGKSGCGKTTLMKQLKPTLSPAGTRMGQILFKGMNLSSVDECTQAQKIGFVLQDIDAQIVTETVWHELAFGLENLGIDEDAMHRKIAEMACYFGIEDLLYEDVADLSGGQKQLLNLASIMAMDPEVLILDEPTAQLDPIAAQSFLDAIKRINSELGCTIIISEQRLEQVYGESDMVLFMDKGRSAIFAPPNEVASELMSASDPMFSALPAPIQISQKVEGASHSEKKEVIDLPLTIKEGRTWLKAYIENQFSRNQRTGPTLSVEKATSSPPLLEVNGLWFRYGRDSSDILRDLSLTVNENTTHCIVGGNGAGKSTLLAALCGVLHPYRGSIHLDGNKISRKRDRHSFDIAMLPQDPKNLFSSSTVQEDLEEMLPKAERNTESGQERIKTVASLCEIERFLSRHPYDLSGGEIQRAALAKVLLLSPRLLLLDEPTKGMDAVFKNELASIFADLKEMGTTILMVSHDIEFCARYADEVSLLFDGHIVANGDPRSFFSNNTFYTTAACKMSHGIFENTITVDDVVELCLS